MKSRILKGIIIISTILVASVTYNACCDTEPATYTIKAVFVANSIDTIDTLIYDKFSLDVRIDEQYACNQNAGSLFITSTYADNLRFCDPVDLVDTDPFVSFKIFDLLDSKKDISYLFRNGEDSISKIKLTEYPNYVVFRSPYPVAKQFKLLLEVELSSGRKLHDTLNPIYLHE